MANIVKGTIGNDDVELNNAATESTLAAILSQNRVDTKILMELAKAAKVDNKVLEKISKSLGDKGPETKEANTGLADIAKKGSVVGMVFSDIAQSIGATIGNLAGFAGMLVEGTANGEAFFKAFKDLPLGIGMFANLLAMAQKLQQENLNTYTSISQAGVGLVGSLNEQRLYAQNLFLSQEEYISMMTKHAGVLENLTAGNQKGGKALVEINSALIQSKMGAELRALGYTYSQINDLLPNYLKMTGDGIRKGKDELEERARLTEATKEYGENLDFLARLAREDRESVQAKIQAANEEAAWQQYVVNQQNPKVRESMTNLVNAMVELAGPGGVDTAKAMMAGFVGSGTDAAKTFQSLQPAMREIAQKYAKLAREGLLTEAEARKQMMKDILVSAQVDNKQGREINALTLVGTKKLNEQQIFLAKGTSVLTAQQIQGVKAISDYVDGIEEKQKADKLATDAAVNNEREWKQLTASINTALQPAFNLLIKVGNNLAERFGKWVLNILPDVEKGLKNVADFIDLAFKDPEAAWGKIAGWFKEILGRMLTAMSQSTLGKYLFGDLGKTLQREGAVEKLKGLDTERLKNLEDRYADSATRDKMSKDEIAEMQSLNKVFKEGSFALAATLREKGNKAWEGSNNTSNVIEAQARARSQNAGFDNLGKAEQNVIMNQIYSKMAEDWNTKRKGMIQQASDIESGKVSSQDVLAEVRKGISDNQFAYGTIGKGKMIRDFGAGQLAQLHGKEAVMTEEQINNLATGAYKMGATEGNSNGSNATTIEIPDIKLMAETLLTLNKQATLQTKVLEQVADYQRRLLDKTQGNRYYG